MTVALQQQTLESEYAATLTGQTIVEIRPQVQGVITKKCIKDGDKVQKGQALFIIDQVPYQAALNVAIANVRTAEAKLATARLALESQTSLEQNQIIGDYGVKTAQNAVQEAEANLQQAKAQEINARNNLSYTVVKSPVNGVAGMIPYHVGALVSSSISEPLVKVTDDAEIYAYFSITENQAIDLIQQYGSMEKYIKEAPDVTFKMSNGDTYPVKGRIDAVSGIVEEGTGAVSLRATFANNEHLLHNGGTGTVVMPAQMDSCIVIPQKATMELQNKIFTFKVVDGIATSTPIEVFRLNNGTEYVVTKGLKPGDVIVAEGAGLLKDGTEITPQK